MQNIALFSLQHFLSDFTVWIETSRHELIRSSRSVTVYTAPYTLVLGSTCIETSRHKLIGSSRYVIVYTAPYTLVHGLIFSKFLTN